LKKAKTTHAHVGEVPSMMNPFKAETLNRRTYFGCSVALLAAFALLAPVTHGLAARTGDLAFPAAYVFAFGMAFGYLSAKRVLDFGGQAELWVMVIAVATLCEASPFLEPQMSADAAMVLFELAAIIFSAVYVTLLLRRGRSPARPATA
jgi:hypothetical protein